MKKINSVSFFEIDSTWKQHWKDMPIYIHNDISPCKSLKIHFRDFSDVADFSKLINQKITEKTKSLWFPKLNKLEITDIIRNKSNNKQPKYPIYIVSKGRWQSRLTCKSLDSLNISYYIVVEPQEYKKYASVIDTNKILTLPFSNLNKGSIPARNWIWEHSISLGANKHWILDDNINGFIYQNNNKRVLLKDSVGFITIENFCDRYKNIALAGMHYRFFAPPNIKDLPPFYLNTRIYSCILINNSIPYRWRGKYNEDTDLSIRALKDNWCTVLFNIFKINKIATMKMKGGNTDELYKKDGRLEMAKSLKKQHSDIVKITRKWGRWQHHVDYSRFKKNKLLLISEESEENYFDDILNKLYRKFDRQMKGRQNEQ